MSLTTQDEGMVGLPHLVNVSSPALLTTTNGSIQNSSHLEPLVPQQFLHQQNLKFNISIAPTLAYLLFVLVAGTVGNAIMLVVYCRRFRPGFTRTYILAMCVCALLTTTLSLPAEALEIRYYVTFRIALACKLSRSVKSFFTFLAAYILVVVALDRHRKICGPYFRRTAFVSAGWNLLACVLFSGLVTVPYTVLSGPQTVAFPGVNISGFRCSIDNDYVNSPLHVINNIIAGLTFIACFLITSVSYVRIARRIWQHQRGTAAARRRALSAGRFGEGETKNNTPSVQVQIHTDDEAVGNEMSNEISGGRQSEREANNTTDNLAIVCVHPDLNSSRDGNSQITHHNLNIPGWKPNRSGSMSSDNSSLRAIHTSAGISTEKINEVSTCKQPTDKPVETAAEVQGRQNASDSTAAENHALTELTTVGVSARKEQHHVPAKENPKRQMGPKGHRKIPTGTTFTMFVLTVICIFMNYFPYILMASLGGYRKRLEEVMGLNGYHLCLRSYFVHCVFNPLVHCFCSARFRRECRRLWSCRS